MKKVGPFTPDSLTRVLSLWAISGETMRAAMGQWRRKMAGSPKGGLRDSDEKAMSVEEKDCN